MAAPIDPKELLLSNKALIGAYVFAIVPIALYFVIVGDMATQVEQKQSRLQQAQNQLRGYHQQLEDAENPLYTERDKERLIARNTLYEAELKKLDGVVEKRDAPLESWFEKFKGDDEPEFNDYVTEWSQNQVPELVSKYSDLLGEAGQSLLFVDVPGRSELRTFQKRFWIQAAILEALEKGKASELMSPGIDFKSPRKGPGGTFMVVPVSLSLRCSFTKVPAILKELLSTQLTTRIEEVSVRKAGFEIERDNMLINGNRKVFLEFAYGENLEKGDVIPQNPDTVIAEPDVHVEIDLAVYDFGKSESSQ